MKRFVLAVALSIGLSGCAALQAIQAGSGTISQAAPDTVATAKRLLTAAHDAHRGVADFLTIAATTNLCHAKCASDARKLLDQSETVLVDADGLLKLGDTPGVEAKIAQATSLIGKIQSQIGNN